MSLRDSTKRNTFDLMGNNLPPLPNYPMPTPRIISSNNNNNKTLSMKNTLLINEIESRKRESEKQKEKLSERRELVMKSGRKN
jgi:dihydrofolate reductase